MILFLISLGIFAFDDYGVFMTNNGIGVPTSIEASNSIIDEVHIKQDTSLTFTSQKENWLPSTIGIAKFQDDLHYGNFTLYSQEITHLKFKKRLTNSLQWITFSTVVFDKDVTTYETIDRLIEADEEYQYGICASTDTIEGDLKTATITTSFDGMFISDKDSYYKLIYNYNLGDIVSNQGNSIIETLGSVYPTIMYSSTNYQTGSLQCMLISDTTLLAGGAIDIKVEKALRKQIMTFLTNKKAKLLKDSSGNFMVISIVGMPKLTPHNELSQQLYDLSFEFIEICDATNEDSLILVDLI